MKVFKRLFIFIVCFLLILIGNYFLFNYLGLSLLVNILLSIVLTILMLYIGFFIILKIRSKKQKDRLLFISSTGGHFKEMIQLEKLMKKYESLIVTEKTAHTLSLRNDYEKMEFLVHGTKEQGLRYVFKLMYNCFKMLYFFLVFNPDVLISTGAHVGGPMLLIGKLFGKKTIFIESFANSKSKTITGKFLYPFVDTFIVQWESMLLLYPKAIYMGAVF